MKCLLWQPMVFVNGYHWFVRLHLVGSTVFTGLCGYIWWADDGYSEMSAWATHGVCHRVPLDCAATMRMMATMKCLLGQPMVFVNGYHWFVRLHLVGSTVITGLRGYIWWADDGYGEMSAWTTHGVCHRVSLDCAATIGGLLGHLTVSCLGNS